MYRIKPKLLRSGTDATSNSQVVPLKDNYITIKNTNGLSSQSISSAPINLSSCICMVVTNCGDIYEKIIKEITTLQRYFTKSYVIFVESNSHDDSQTVFSKPRPSTAFIHLENANDTCLRNAYINFVIQNAGLFNVMIVIDPRVFTCPEIECFDVCMGNKYESWDAIFANQSYKYYDIKNLLSKHHRIEVKDNSEDARREKMKSMQHHIPVDDEAIPVISAFGGLAIYKTKFINKTTYYKDDDHVSFNISYNKQTSRMFIQPSLVIETPEDCGRLYINL